MATQMDGASMPPGPPEGRACFQIGGWYEPSPTKDRLRRKWFSVSGLTLPFGGPELVSTLEEVVMGSCRLGNDVKLDQTITATLKKSAKVIAFPVMRPAATARQYALAA